MTPNLQTRRYRIEWMLLGTVLLSLGALLGYGLYGERLQVEAREQDRLQAQARVIDMNLGRQLEGANNALVAVRNGIADFDSRDFGPTFSRRLRVLSDAMPGVRTMFVANAQGLVLAASRDELIGLSAARREYFTVPRERPDPATLYVSAPFVTTLGVYSINIVRAVIGAKGEFAGIVSATLDPEYFNVLLQSVLYAPDMRIAIAHGDGVVFLYVPPGDRTAGIDLAQPGSFFTRHRDSGQIATIMTGTVYATEEERMVAMRTIRPARVPMDKSLVVAVGRDLGAIYAPWRKNVLVNGGLYGAIVLSTSLGLFITQRRQRKLDRIEADHARDRRESDQRQALALRASEEKYRGIFDSLHDLYVETDLEGTILDIGPNVEALSGGQYRKEDLLGKSAEAFYCEPARRTEFLRTLTLVGSVKDFESTFINRDGTAVPCSISANIRRDPAGKPARIVSSVRDITARKRAQESLRESEERLRAIFDAAADGILVADAGSGKFQAGNPAICRMLGYTLEEIARLGVSDVHPRQDLAPLIGGFEKLQRGETRLVADFPVIRKDGSTFRADMHLAPIRLGGKDCGLAIIRDISERRRAEEDLQRAAEALRQAYRRLAQVQDAEQRNLAKELHDQVGQNLSALSLTLNLIERELPEESKARLQGRLDEAMGVVGDTTERIRNLLGVLRPPMLDEYGLYATLRWCAHETTHLSGIECKLEGVEPAQRLPAEIESGFMRIAQEALMNAAKYSRARRITMRLRAEAPVARLEIADDGVGFEPDNEERAEAKPTWGIRNMRERAAGLGGQLHIASASGGGTRVLVEIPLPPG